MIVPTTRNQQNNFIVARLHYTLDPDKARPDWKERTMRGMPRDPRTREPLAWNREYELDYSTYVGQAVFPEFTELNIREITVEPKDMLYVGWDFGFRRPAVVVTKLNQFDQWCWIKGIIGKDEGILRFGKRVGEFLLSEYPGCRYIHSCDPAGHQKTDKAEKTSIEVLQSLEIFPVSRSSPVNEGIEIIRQKLVMRDDGKVGLLVNSGEADLIDGFKGGYRYKENREGEPEKEEIEKDGYFQHLFDAARYIAVNQFSLVETGKQELNPITKQEIPRYRRDPTQNIIPEMGGMKDLF
jgi:hypothetical protein